MGSPKAGVFGSRSGQRRAPREVFSTLAASTRSGKICYTLTAFRIAPATTVHIHLGPAGVAGDVVVELRPPTFGISSGCTSADPELVGDIAANPWEY